MHASVVSSAALRVVGEVHVDITAYHVGTPEQEAAMRMDELLIYIRSAALAERIAQLWRQSRALCAATLPKVGQPSKLRVPARVALIGVIVRLGGEPPCTVLGLPARPRVAQPAHVRIQVGPLVWEVCDKAAWHTLTNAWEAVSELLTQPA